MFEKVTGNNAGQYYPDYAYNHPLFTNDMKTQKKLAEKFVKSNVGLQKAQLFAGHAGLKLKNKPFS